ncbi:capsule biosynthesis protein [Dinoroseobacter sp. S76]|uniref:capsule biosynthesis protein n=1 Tax=Dinoroseobacter sp. S76 TaxID=3415124 RepID=UPI003C79C26F
MEITSSGQRRILFLQGPHGPFFAQLADLLTRSGATCWRVGFNAGDARFWTDRARYLPYDGSPEDWPQTCAQILTERAITDLVLYGDVRAIHRSAIRAAERRGLRVHVFEEGYLRPSWVTYERGGANGYSRLMSLDISEMTEALNGHMPELPSAPARWGDMRQHVFYGALYHFHVLFRNGDYAAFKPHRALSVRREFLLYLKVLLKLPATMLERWVATRRVRVGGFPYHLFLLQLDHDSAFQAHSGYETMAEVLAEVVAAFAQSAPGHHHLVFKAHPLEDGRAQIRAEIARIAKRFGVSDRVHYVPGGKLARILDQARSVLTVNSTAAQQALWRGLPVKCLGRAIYDKPELVSAQPLPEFFRDPIPPDMRAYRNFRHFLLESSQVTGGFYSAEGRQHLLRQVADMILSKKDPYEALETGAPRRRHPLRVVK